MPDPQSPTRDAVIIQRLNQLYALERLNHSLARAAASAGLRQLDSTDPNSWEFSGFSQNGEDGILDYLSRRLRHPNRYFVEIGASDGAENNTSWLALGRRWQGLMIEGHRGAAERCQQTIGTLNGGVVVRHAYVTRAAVAELMSRTVFQDPDVFSLDIDGVDYYIAAAILAAAIRPKIFVVEYNSAFGPDRALTVEYRDDFVCRLAHPTMLYYGVAVAGWKAFFAHHGYHFVTVDQNGVNAFFIDPAAFDPEFVAALRGCAFRENFWQMRQHRRPWQGQFELIRDQPFVAIA